jgi:hypothetical protein
MASQLPEPRAYAEKPKRHGKRPITIVLEYRGREARIAIPSSASSSEDTPELEILRAELFEIKAALEKLLRSDFDLEWKRGSS